MTDDTKQMHKGNWTCGECGAGIDQLPFEPNPNSLDRLRCYDCYKKGKAPTGGGGERQMFEGNWSCSDCGTAITKLPFQPKDGLPLRCMDCHKKGQTT